MPFTDDLISDLDDFQDPQQPPELDSPPLPTPVKKSTNKKKNKKHVAQARRQLDEDEDTPYAKSVTPSPPDHHGVRLDTPSPPAEEPEQDFQPDLLLEETLEPPTSTWEVDQTPIEELSPPLSPAPHPSQTVEPPRPVPVKSAPPTATPPHPPSGPYSPSQHYTSLGRLQSTSSAGQHQTSPSRQGSLATQQTSPHPRIAQPMPQSRFVEAPPPQMPQPHFFGLPDLGMGLTAKPEKGKAAGTDGYCCTFDSFAAAGDAVSARKAKDALLVGSEGGLDVYKVTPDKFEVVGRLEGLRGAVIGARVLPQTAMHDTLLPSRPLVVVVVHGPLSEDRRDSGNDDDVVQEPKGIYQTTVEVYSLQTQQHIATLYSSAKVAMERPVVGQVTLPPGPVGDLNLDVAGTFITVTSGRSGEVFVFSGVSQLNYDEQTFRCVGKFWTALQPKPDASRPTTASDAGGGTGQSEAQRGVPLLSLSQRWLAVVPPYTSASISIQGTPLLPEGGVSQPVGLTTHIAPSQPAITCEVAGIDAEGTLSWLSRKAAQGLVKASQRGYEISMQGWRELTHPTPLPAQPSHQHSTSHEPNLFPPTNGPADDPKRLAKEPALVSIIDLQRLLHAEEQKPKQAPSPLATFALVDGCSHLSFPPDGLRLLTSNRRGEVATIWDLKHIAHGSTKISTSPEEEDMERGPHIKQIHRIPRSSPSVIIDSVWSRDGDWLALLTAQGTAHLHEVPLVAAPRRRKRKPIPPQPAPDKAEPTVSISHANSPPSSNGIMASWRSWGQSVSTQVHALRTQQSPLTASSALAGLRDTAAAAGVAGRRAVTKGFGQGYSAAKSGASDMWHAEDNKVRLKASLPDGLTSGRMRWVQRRGGVALGVVAEGAVDLFPVQRVARRKGEAVVTGLKRDRHHSHFPLPRIGSIEAGPATAQVAGCVGEGPHGFWSLAPTLGNAPARLPLAAQSTAAAASEVETNPPYCPFHVDSRVSIYAFHDGSGSGGGGYDSQAGLYSGVGNAAMLDFRIHGHGAVEDDSAWVFGAPLPPSSKMNDRSAISEAGDVHHDNEELDPDEDEELAEQVESRLTFERAGVGEAEQIRVSSRRSRRGGGRSAGAGESGFGDEEVGL